MRKKSSWYSAAIVTFTGTLLVAASVVQASDLQIYARPTAGKKTIVMMLDTSGSMGGGSIGEDYGLTESVDNGCTTESSGTTPAYTRYYCPSSLATRNVDQCSNNKCYDRLSRLKDGMFTFLNNTDTKFNNVVVGLGNFSADGDGRSGQILVPAVALGSVGSTQRTALKTTIAGLSAGGTTPSAHAYAEAAAYLMGTTTLPAIMENDTNLYSARQEIYRTVGNGNNTKYYTCNQFRGIDYNQDGIPTYQGCNESGGQWVETTASVNLNGLSYTSSGNTRWYTQVVQLPAIKNFYTVNQEIFRKFGSSYSTCNRFRERFEYSNGIPTYQRCDEPGGAWQPVASDPGVTGPGISGNTWYTRQAIIGWFSGLYKSAFNTKKAPVADTRDSNFYTYQSPLPAASDQVSCDGQGIYFLSDGQPNSTYTSTTTPMMKAALGEQGSSFSCPTTGLTGGGSGWACMGEFAKKLYNPANNPSGVSIKTAFVGFGKDFSNLSTDDAKNACKLGSRSNADRKGDDSCSPNQSSNANPANGYGNGGFFQANSADSVTDSVVKFLDNLNNKPLAPLATGAASIPVDTLNPNGLQSFGYLRALEPNPSNSVLTWRGNLKKYYVLNGALTDGSSASSNQVFNRVGGFSSNTKDIWNNTNVNDGGIVDQGGAYSRVPMPTNRVNAVPAVPAYPHAIPPTPAIPAIPAIPASPNAVRPLFTDVSAVASGVLTGITTHDASLLKVPNSPTVPAVSNGTYILSQFNTDSGQSVLKDFPLLIKLKLLNYLGYSIDLGTTALPTTLNTPDGRFLSMGGMIHSQPVQLTYSGTVDANNRLTRTRTQSVLYGSMEGGLHVVDAETGVEQMVFVPAEILNSSASKALRVAETDINAPAHGIDAEWVADPAYKFVKSTTSGEASTVTARQMNVYGGLRMGGNSYYALNLLNPAAPKLLFRIGADQTNFSRMGQSWSKPVLANIRYNGAIKRVMIVGGGYDMCYENPRITLNNSCFTDGKAKGNAVYIVDASTGARLWWATDVGANTDNANMKHSIVSRISTLDRDADGLVDHLYFGDLGGQVFRADLNNASQVSSGHTSSFGVRVTRLANLATTAAGIDITNGDNPRFYQAPTVTIHRSPKTFILVGLASGDRSTPLDVAPTLGREGMSPSTALTGRLVNNVYGVIDRDFVKRNLITNNPAVVLQTENTTLATFKKDPQTISTTVADQFFPSRGDGYHGWYRSLSSVTNADGTVTEKADGTFRKPGGMKSFEDLIALTGNLLVPVYDPEGTGVAVGNPCEARVIGETDQQRYCLPFGVCLSANGNRDMSYQGEGGTGFQLSTTTGGDANGSCTKLGGCNDKIMGAGIRGVSLAPAEGTCSITVLGNQSGSGVWACAPKLNPTRWYEKYAR